MSFYEMVKLILTNQISLNTEKNSSSFPLTSSTFKTVCTGITFLKFYLFGVICWEIMKYKNEQHDCSSLSELIPTHHLGDSIKVGF